MSQVSASFIIETLEAVEEEMISRGERFRPLTLDVARCIGRLNEFSDLKELDDEDDWD